MKKMLAVFCIAALSVMTCVAPFAAENGSPTNPVNPPRPPRPPYVSPTDGGGNAGGGSSSQSSSAASNTSSNTAAAPAQTPAVTGTPATIDTSATTVAIPAGDSVVIADVNPADFQNDPALSEIIKALAALGTDGQQHTTAEIFESLGVTTSTAQTEPSNTIINVDSLEAITKLLDFKFGKAGTRLPNGKIKASFPGNALTQGKKAEQLVIVQIDPVAKNNDGKPAIHFVDVAIDSSNNTLTAEFPCAGPFYVMQRTDVQ